MMVNFTNENNQTASAPMQHVHLTHSAGLLNLPFMFLNYNKIININKRLHNRIRSQPELFICI